MAQLAAFVRAEGTAFFAALTLAFALFEGLDSFLEFCRWLQPAVYYWRYYLYLLIDTMFFWLPFSLPSSVKDVFALAILFFLVVMRTQRQTNDLLSKPADEVAEKVGSQLSWYIKTVILSTALVLSFFLLPMLGWYQVEPSGPEDTVNAADSVLSFIPRMIRGFVAMAAIGLIVFLPSKIEYNVIRGYFSRHMWRVSTIFLVLCFVNFIGLKADDIGSWREWPFGPAAAQQRGVSAALLEALCCSHGERSTTLCTS